MVKSHSKANCFDPQQFSFIDEQPIVIVLKEKNSKTRRMLAWGNI